MICETSGSVDPVTHSPNCDIIGYPASFAQRRIWFIDQLEPVGAAYNEPCAMRLSGPIDIDLLERSMNEIVQRHEILRTSYSSQNGELVQIVAPFLRLTLALEDLTTLPEMEREARAAEAIRSEIRRPFNLAQGPIIRAALFRLTDTEHLFLFTTHHIAMDGWSMRVLLEEISSLYPALAQGRTDSLPILPIQYIDYAIWQHEAALSRSFDEAASYWKRQLSGAPPVLDLPTDRPRSAVQSYNGARHSVLISPVLVDAMKELGRSEHVTLYMLLLSAFNVLLSRYTCQDEIVLGSPIAGRTEADTSKLIGLFVNTLVLRTNLTGDPTFLELLGRVRDVALGAYAHQELPFEKLVEQLAPERDLSRSPLFQIMFIFQEAPQYALHLPHVEVTPFAAHGGSAKLDLTLSVMESIHGLDVCFEYNTDLLDVATIERMSAHLVTLVGSIVANPRRKLSQLRLQTDEELQKVLVEWNVTGTQYPDTVSTAELVEAQAARTPDKIAVVFENTSLTYRELNAKANRVGNYLKTLDVGPDVLVGVCLDRSLDLIVGLLGIWKAGGAYVPLDPAYPSSRLSMMLDDSRLRVLLTAEALLELLPLSTVRAVCLDGRRDRELIDAQDECNSSKAAGGQNLAYVLYTSGSTGRPKGVEIEHRSLVNLLCSMQCQPGLAVEDVLVAVTTLSFDIAGLELWLPLITGARLVIAGRRTAMDGSALAELLVNVNATIMQATPATWRILLEAGWMGRPDFKILCGGEALSLELARQLHSRGASLWNMYGPTETTIWSTFKQIEVDSDPILIGRPIANTQVYLLDAHLQPSLIGVPGEIYIGGDGLARGYLNRPDLTAERFIQHPFIGEHGGRLYRTGDKARYLPDGNIDCLGRLDNQLKIRGYRIEAGEIESSLRQHPSVADVIVVPRDDVYGDTKLVAYLVCVKGGKPTPKSNELRSLLKEKLPDYMVPSAFVFLDAFTLTPNGKVDRTALPVLDQTQHERTIHSRPQDELERELVSIWEEVLHCGPVGVLDNFFDLGGHSLLAIRLFQVIANRLRVQLPLATLFRAQNVKSLAELIRESEPPSSGSAIVPLQVAGSLPPLFCGPVSGGSAYFYRSLALTVGSEQPLYTFEPRGTDGVNEPFETVEEMASYYIDNMRTVQPEGPYYLGGLSFGGVIAFEMAKQLHAGSERVAVVAMVDSFAPGYPKSITHANTHRTYFAALWYRIVHHRENLAVCPSLRSKLSYMRVRAGFMVSKGARRNSGSTDLFEARRRQLNLPEMLQKVAEAEARALKLYKPEPYRGEIKLLKARAGSPHFMPAKYNGWEGLASGGIELIVTPGTHYSMLDEPCIHTTLKRLKRLIEDARQPCGKTNTE